MPPDIDLSYLIGAELIQVCVGENQIQLRFVPDGLSISVESDITVSGGGGAIQTVSVFPRDAGALLPLLGQRVSNWRRISERALEIAFDRGVQITLSDSSDRYESFQIKGPGGLLVV